MLVFKDIFYFLFPLLVFFSIVVEEFTGNLGLEYKTALNMVLCFVLAIVYVQGLYPMRD